MFVRDRHGNTVFMVLSKFGHLWTLNFMYMHISTRFGLARALEHLNAVNCEGVSALDMAAHSGDVNVIELLIRRGCDLGLNRPDHCSPLYWAVRHNRYEAVRFLVLCGCNPCASDPRHQSPQELAEDERLPDILELLKRSRKQYIREKSRRARITDGDSQVSPFGHFLFSFGNSAPTSPPPDTSAAAASASAKEFEMVQVQEDLECGKRQSSVLYHTESVHGTVVKRSHAVYRLNPTRIDYTLYYGLFVFFMLTSSIYMACWVWFIMVVGVAYVYR